MGLLSECHSVNGGRGGVRRGSLGSEAVRWWFAARAAMVVLSIVAGVVMLHSWGARASVEAVGGRPDRLVHVVKSGESLWSIAQRYSSRCAISAQGIAEQNQITGPVLEVGQTVFFSCAPRSPASS